MKKMLAYKTKKNKDMRQILIATDFFPKIGGAHYWLYQVYKYWPEQVVAYVQDYVNDMALADLQVEFDKEDHGPLELRRLDLSLRGGSLLQPKNFLRVLKIGRCLSKCSSSDICLHVLRTIFDSYYAVFAKFLAPTRTKLILYAHGEEFFVAKTSREFRFLTKMALKKADLIIANSHFTKRQVREFFSKAQVEVIHLGVNYKDFQIPLSKALAYRHKWGFHENDVILLTLARMESRKNHARVLRGLEKLIREGLSVGYVIIGIGEEEEHLKTLVRELRIGDKVRFLGRVSEEEKYLAFNAADIYVMPSIQHGSMIEGFGIVFLEAAAAGIPSIAGNVGGQPEAVLHGKTGLVVDGTDEKELREALRYLILNPEVRKKMGKIGREWAKQHDWKKISQKIYEAVSSVCLRA